MLGVSGLMGSSGEGAAAAAVAETHESGGASGGSSEVGAASSVPGGGGEEIERSGGGRGNRWPRQETLALLKFRSDMDVAFRDASLKGPLWEEVSRKMAELGFQRSAKKCKEKFENVHKYHKRTKDGRASKPDGKTYRFFDQLEALENRAPNHFSPPPPRPQPPATATMAVPVNATNVPMPSHATVSSTSPTPLSVVPPNTAPNIVTYPINSSSFQLSQPPLQPPPLNASIPPQSHNFQPSYQLVSASMLSNSTSSSTSSDEDIQRRRGRKRKWKDYFERLMKDVIQKQEELQKKFLDALEKRERDRMAREEAWRVQEMARMNREHDLLVQERSIAATKDGALIAFLQKVTGENNFQIPITNNATQQVPMQVQAPENPPSPPPPPPQPQQSTPAEPPAQAIVMATPTKIIETSNRDNGGDDHHMPTSSSRWPKAEVEALIKLRTDLEVKYQENGPKGPLWEDISKSMAKLGYNRSSKRCKEKWENINKYFKKVKESNKKRPDDSKTCPYFYQLEAIYKEKAKNNHSSFNLGYAMQAENPMVPIMAQPEQQWPLPEQQQEQNPVMHDQDHENESENNDHEDNDDEDDEDEDEVGEYEIITNKQPPSLTNTVE